MTNVKWMYAFGKLLKNVAKRLLHLSFLIGHWSLLSNPALQPLPDIGEDLFSPEVDGEGVEHVGVFDQLLVA